MQNTTRFKRLQHTLMLAFLVLSITPLILSALFFLRSHSTDLVQQSTNHLASLLDNQKKQLSDFFTARESEVQSFARSELANASGGRFYGLVGAYHQLGDINAQLSKTGRARYFSETLTTKSNLTQTASNYVGHERYRLMYKRYNWAYDEYLKRSNFSDILLVDLKGNIVYSAYTPEMFSINLGQATQPYPALSKTFAAIKAKTESSSNEPDQVPVVFTDFSTEPGQQDLAAWFAAPIIQQGYLHSYVFFRLDNHVISELLGTTSNGAHSVQTLLVGQDHHSRLPATANEPKTYSSQSIDQALSGNHGVGSFTNFSGISVLSAFSPVKIMGSEWALVVELPEKEAFARIHQLEIIFLVAMVTAIILVIIASHWLSNSITAPLLRLTWAAERVSAGDMDQKIESTDRSDEIGRLAISFARMQSSIREKMILIREQNTKLEHNLQLIQQKNNELQTADKLKDEFLATTSHELRTPLHGMVGIAESLLAGANGPVQRSQRRQLEIMINSGQRLTNLVDDLLDYHKMRYGDMDIQKQAVDVASAVRLVLELSGHLLGSKPVRIINQIPDDLPPIAGDEQRLEQVLYNLVGNAIKYTSEGKIILSATMLENQLRIQVVDTGQGIPPDQLEHIFEPLTQANTHSAQYRQGSGLGLSISRQLIELMGGRLYVSSQPMIGTTFSFTLNLASKQEIAESQLNSRNQHFQAPNCETAINDIDDIPENPDGDLLLVVDDEPVNLQVLKNFLRLEGYRVATAESGPQALKMIEENPPALLLLDIMMPDMSGYEVCEQLRQRYSMTELPVIMLSALGQVQDRIRGFESGANDYLTKPFNKEELTARIGAHLKAGQTEIQRRENQRLAEEIARREAVEAGLLETQSRLLGLLESTNEAIICIQSGGRIRYANSAAGKLFNRSPEHIERHHIEDILATHLPEDIHTLHHFHGELMFRIGDSLTTLNTDVINLPEASGLQRMFIFDNQGQTDSHRIEVLENAVDVLSDYAFNGDKGNLEKLRHLGDEFQNIANKLGDGGKSKQDTMRDLVVDVMKQTLKHWETCTGKTKFDLAEESGLWRVYLDRSTLQTRTLDKYLHLESLPKTPRWRNVLSTVDFVLDRCPASSPAQQQLNQAKERLQQLISQ
ncbi:histidine kinase [Photobacterium aquae]|uniref:histidine kinase n=1 Tax=Photobacterium aquae TaxID=1195763 RepID=A0A0J1GXJ2_9GAMM|nr:response regulator [Photobacterium aquae]KLV04370.1 histidine kinase [Photobacterium aquae]